MVKFIFWQCLLHRPGFQHLIAAARAAAVVFFCCSIYYLSGWHRCPNPNSNNKILEKKKDFEVKSLSSANLKKRVMQVSIPQPSALQPSVLTIRASNTICQNAVFKSNQCEKRNLVQQRFDVRNRDGAVDTSLFFQLLPILA